MRKKRTGRLLSSEKWSVRKIFILILMKVININILQSSMVIYVLTVMSFGLLCSSLVSVLVRVLF